MRLRVFHHPALLTRIAMVVGIATTVVPILALAAQPEPVFVLRRGAIVDSARGAAYVSKPNGTIDAVDLTSGRTLWTSDEAAVPLGADDALVIAQYEESPRATERLRLVVLDSTGGGKVSEVSIALPAGVRGLVNDEKGRSLRVAAEREGALFLVSWLYREQVVRGIPPRSGEETVRLFAGSARVQPQLGKIITAEGGTVVEAPERWKRYGTPPAPPWRSGNVAATTEGGRGGPLTLKRKDVVSGQPLPDHALSSRAIVALPSADQRHVLATERVGTGEFDDPEYLWSVFAIESAESATELRRDVSAEPFFVFHDSIILESAAHGYVVGELRVDEPLQLRAIRLSTGVVKWQAELRDLGYRGSFVPPEVRGRR